MSNQSTDDGYLASPPGECCAKGTLHNGETRGAFETIADLKTYVSKPAEGTANGHIILYFPDIWNLTNNALLMMDRYADAGYLVVGVDYLQGDTITKYQGPGGQGWIEGFDFWGWCTKYLAYAEGVAPGWVTAVKEKYGKADTKYASVGYCFGGPFVCNELISGRSEVGAFGHPAFLKDHHFSTLQKPLLLSCAETDSTFGTENRRKAVDILRKENKIYNVQLFQGVEHGFAVRCNLDNPYERWVKEQSHAGIVSWFNFWLSQ